MTTNWAIITADTAEKRFEFGSSSEGAVILSAPDEAAASQTAATLLSEGVVDVQLCGATGPLWAAAVIPAVGDRARVGTVLYGMESMTSIARFKERFEAGEPLTEAFILRCKGANPVIDRLEDGRRTYIAVPDDAAAADAAAELDARLGGVQLIELYGGFRPNGIAQVIKATGGGRVPVGAVYYGP
jgi:hypothetical protein